MRKTSRYLAYFIALSLFSSGALSYATVVGAQPTNRCANSYWVGGAGSFSDSEHHWASSSGGSVGDCRVPASNDVLYFDSHSGSGTVIQDVPNLVTGPLQMAAGTNIVISIANGTSWQIVSSFSQTDPGIIVVAQAMNVLWILLFFAVCGAIIFGAWTIRQRMGGS